MSHTYASVADLKGFIKDSGAAASGGLGTSNDVLFLTFLEDASRSIDAYCARTGSGFPMSGFGPRVGTNRYDGPGGRFLDLDDDLLSITSVAASPGLGATPITYTDETDFYKGPYDAAPYRELTTNLLGMPSWYSVQRGVVVSGIWGYSNDLVLSTTTVSSGLSLSATAASFTTSASPTISPGQTLRIGSEDLYLTGLTTTTAAVDRHSNGTTAATHIDASAISTYRYPRQVVRTCLALALRRWKLRDSGSSGPLLVPGGGMVTSDPSEMSILRNGVASLALIRLS